MDYGTCSEAASHQLKFQPKVMTILQCHISRHYTFFHYDPFEGRFDITLSRYAKDMRLENDEIVS